MRRTFPKSASGHFTSQKYLAVTPMPNYITVIRAVGVMRS
ncbi:hypothetical protein SAMN05444374_101390 [Rhodococcoides kroppenstedtii]|uniref:Uncharacterized protein n=1 Tax=Rhodococcoides kroppenstedtii TaxID=293050 RepID=A0A1I0SK93_9NOCA|nr:hypothetical protein A3Q40_00936 [Rhodococcus sp. PBTS 1]SFA39929.1 hypothetical protein SAMN05444374_101390 [Rhodococcus kroppenstedtii]